MNRRHFFRAAATAILGFAFLPGAGRTWKPSAPAWQRRRATHTTFDPVAYTGEWRFIYIRNLYSLPRVIELPVGPGKWPAGMGEVLSPKITRQA